MEGRAVTPVRGPTPTVHFESDEAGTFVHNKTQATTPCFSEVAQVCLQEAIHQGHAGSCVEVNGHRRQLWTGLRQPAAENDTHQDHHTWSYNCRCQQCEHGATAVKAHIVLATYCWIGQLHD